MKAFLILLLAVVGTHAASTTLRIHNSGSVPVNVVSSWTTSGGGSGQNLGTLQPGASMNSFVTPGANCTHMGVYWSLGGAPYTDSIITGGGAGGNGYTFSSQNLSGVTLPFGGVNYFEVGQYTAPAPIVYYRFDADLQNGTHVNQTYTLLKTETGVVDEIFTLYPGQFKNWSRRNLTNQYYLSLKNAPGIFPEFVAYLSPGGTPVYWRLEDSSFSTPWLLVHTVTTPSPNLQWTLQFEHQSTNASENEPLTEGTYKAGVQNTFNQARDQNQNIIQSLTRVETALGGAQLANAATQMNAAGASMATASAGITTAAGSIASAASSLATAANSLSNSTGTAKAPNGEQIQAAKDMVTGMGPPSPANPHSGFTLGAGTTAWGSGTVSDNTVWTYTLPLMGTINLNPLASGIYGPVAPISRNIFIWISSMSLVGFAVSRITKIFSASGTFAQTSGVHVNAAGFGGNWPTALLAMVVMLSALAAIPAAWVAFKGANASVFGLMGMDPMGYIPGAGVLIAYFPIDVMLAHSAIGITFAILLAGITFSVSTIIRMIPR